MCIMGYKQCNWDHTVFYRDEERIGSVACKLQLPDSSTIHPVYHVSQLRAAKGFTKPVQSQLPPLDCRFQVPL